MYILIFDDGSISKADDICDGDLAAAEDGLIDIIDILDSNNPIQYYDGGWHSISKSGE